MYPSHEKIKKLPNGVSIENLRIESFEEVIPIVERAHKTMVPNAFNLGWDVAITTKGIRLIEVNYCSPVLHFFAPNIWQEMQQKKLSHIMSLLMTYAETLSKTQ